MKTDTTCVMPILGCLNAILEYLEDDKDLKVFGGINEMQRRFLNGYGYYIPEIQKVREIMCKADKDYTVINKWLKDNGYDIQLDPPEEADSFSVASILNMLMEWMYVGKKCTVTSSVTKKDYPAVRIRDGFSVVNDREFNHPIICLDTMSGDRVHMTEINEGEIDEKDFFSAQNLAMRLNDIHCREIDHDYKSVIFPMIELDMQPDISWLCGLKHYKTGYYIAQALQQTKFRMNEKGARVESAAAMMCSRGITLSSKPDCYVIDRPFLLWVTRPYVKIPFFTAVLCEDVWKEPKAL